MNVPDSIIESFTRSMTENWAGGFLFEKDFRKSKRFSRYCSKLEDGAHAFLMYTFADEGADAWKSFSLSDMVKDFFKYVIVEAAAAKDVPTEWDWRNIIAGLPFCTATDFASSPQNLQKGWIAVLHDKTTWDDLFEVSFAEACFQYLHQMLITRNDISETTFCVTAVPSTLGEDMAFAKLLLNTIWVGAYATIILATDKDSREEIERQTKIDDLTKESASLLDKLKDIESNVIPSYERQIAEREHQIAELKQEQANAIQAALGKHQTKLNSEIAAERKKAKQAEAEVARLKAKCQELEEQLEIVDEAEDDSEDDVAPTVDLDYNSKIIFIASPPSNGRIEGTHKRLLQKFPNARFIHTADDITPNADCYVILTRYMKHHCLYNSTHDLLLRRKYPCIHSSSQNVDRIAADIFSKSRYA